MENLHLIIISGAGGFILSTICTLAYVKVYKRWTDKTIGGFRCVLATKKEKAHYSKNNSISYEEFDKDGINALYSSSQVVEVKLKGVSYFVVKTRYSAPGEAKKNGNFIYWK